MAKTWNILDPEVGLPGNRQWPAMAYDSARDKIVLFGGEATTGAWTDLGQVGAATFIYALQEFEGKLYIGSDDGGKVYCYDGSTLSLVGTLDSNVRAFTTTAVPSGGPQNRLYAGTWGGKVFRFNGGTSWTDLGGPGPIFALASLSWPTEVIYASSAGNVFKYAGSWTNIGAPGGGADVLSLVYAALPSALVAGTAYPPGRIYAYDPIVPAWNPISNVDIFGSKDIVALGFPGGYLFACPASAGPPNGHVYFYPDDPAWWDLGALGAADSDACAIAAPVNWGVVGTRDGHVYMADFNTVFTPPIIWTALGKPSAGTTRIGAVGGLTAAPFAGDDTGHLYRFNWRSVFEWGPSGPWVEHPNSASHEPGPRYGHIMVYDSDRGVMFMSGGQPKYDSYSNPWLWNGTLWVLNDPDWANFPESSMYSEGLAAAYDSEHKQIVLMPRRNWFFSNTPLLKQDPGSPPPFFTWQEAVVPPPIASGLSDLGHVIEDITAGVSALAIFEDDLYAAVNTAGARVQRWEGGTTWADVSGLLGANDSATSLAVFGGKLYVGTADSGGAVYRRDSDMTWVSVGPVSENTIYALFALGADLYCSGVGGVHQYVSGSTWTPLGGPGEGYCLTSFGGTLYLGCANGNVYRYDGGTTWTSVGTPGSAGTYITSMAVFDGNLYCGFCDGLDYCGRVAKYGGGTSWSDTGISYPGSPPTPAEVEGLIVAGGKLFCCSSSGSAHRFVGGTTWFDLGTILTSALVANGSIVYGAAPENGYDEPHAYCLDYPIGVDSALHEIYSVNDYCLRVGAAMAYDPVRKKVVVFGGRAKIAGYSEFDAWLFDLWEWDGVDDSAPEHQWIRVIPSTVPGARGDCTMAWDPIVGKIILFGGVQRSLNYPDEAKFFGGAWSWDGANFEAVTPEIAITQANFSSFTETQQRLARAGHAMSRNAENVVIFGGLTAYEYFSP